jgi:hypothetical protein
VECHSVGCSKCTAVFCGAATLSIATFSKAALSIEGLLNVTLCINDTQHNNAVPLFIIVLNVIMLSVIMPSAIMLSVIMLSVIVLSVIMVSVMSVIMLSVIMLSVIKLNVMVPLFVPHLHKKTVYLFCFNVSSEVL